jgi:acetyl esterase
MVRSAPEEGAMSDDATIEVDPEIAAILRDAAAAGLPDPTTLPIAAARAQLTEASLAWNVELPPLPVVADFSVPGPAGAIRLRHYRPRAGERLPLVVYLHGGGWTFGSVDTHDRLMRLLALAADAALIGVDYRLAPEHPFPAALEDCLAAIRWLRGRADALEFDAALTVVAGDSAGANLALASVLALRAAGEPLPRGAALFYGCYAARLDTASHARFGDGSYRLSTAEMGWFWRNYLRRAPAGTPLAEPLHADLRGLPPLFLTLAALDPLADDTRALAGRLAAAGVPHEVREYRGLVHGFLQMTARSAAARAAMADAGGAIRRLLSSDS